MHVWAQRRNSLSANAGVDSRTRLPSHLSCSIFLNENHMRRSRHRIPRLACLRIPPTLALLAIPSPCPQRPAPSRGLRARKTMSGTSVLALVRELFWYVQQPWSHSGALPQAVCTQVLCALAKLYTAMHSKLPPRALVPLHFPVFFTPSAATCR